MGPARANFLGEAEADALAPALKPGGPILRASIRSCLYPRSSVPALADINLVVNPGEFVVITGPAGAGKTTLCHCLTGAIPKVIQARVDADVEIAGQPLADLPLPRTSPLVGMVMQSPTNQLFSLTVAEDVAFGPENLRMSPREVRRRMDESLRFTSTEELASRFSHLLSGGESQRVVLSSVLALDAGVFIFDRPAAELDPASRALIYGNIRRLNQEAGKTIVLVEDRLAEVLPYATRLLLLEGGRIARDADPEAFFADGTLHERGVRVPAPIRLYQELAVRDLRLPHRPVTVDDFVREVETLFRPVPRLQVHTPATDVEQREPDIDLAVEVSSVSFRYPAGVEALTGVAFQMRRGESAAIVGQNGAGKTTLAKHLIGLLRPSFGSVRILGRDLARMPVHRVSELVGFVFQDPDYQIFNDSCLLEVAYGLKLRKLPAAEIDARARAALQTVGLADFADWHPYILSRGQRQMLAVASILATEPRVLVVDEPTTGLDYGETQAMTQVLLEFQRAGGTLLVITHDIEVAVSLGQRIIAMSRGRIALDVPVETVGDHLPELEECSVLLPDLAVIAKRLGLSSSARTVQDVADEIVARASEGGDRIGR